VSLKDTKILDTNLDQLLKLIGIGALLPIFINYVVSMVEKVLNVRKFEYHLSGFLVLLILGLIFYLVYRVSNKLFKEDKLKSNIVALSFILLLIVVFNKVILSMLVCKTCGG
jgi:high-affinity Fe2+/Pb2+ permease